MDGWHNYMDSQLLERLDTALSNFLSYAPQQSLLSAPPIRPNRQSHFSSSSSALQPALRQTAGVLQATLSRLKNCIDNSQQLTQKDLSSSAGRLFDELCHDLDHDVEQLCKALRLLATPHPITDNLLVRLRDIATFHEEVLLLLEQYLSFQTLHRDLNKRAKHEEQLERFDENSFRLSDELKNKIFECNATDIVPSTLRLSAIIQNQQASTETGDVIRRSGVLLYKIQKAAAKASGDFFHRFSVNELILMALHWSSRARSLKAVRVANEDATTNGNIYWFSVKSCWLLLCIKSHDSLRESGAEIGLVVNLLVGRALDLLDSIETLTIPSTMVLTELDSVIECTSPPSYAELSLSDTSGTSISRHSSTQGSSDSDQSNLAMFEPMIGEEEMVNIAADDEVTGHIQGFAREIQAAPYQSNLATPSTGDYHSCHVRIFKRRNSTGSLRICTSFQTYETQNQPLKIINVEPQVEMIPEYAYDRTSRLIRFRRGSSPAGDFCYRFPLASPPSEEIYAFHSVFTSDDWLGTFEGATRVELKRSSNGPVTTFDDPTVQIWADPPVELPDIPIPQPSAPISTQARRLNTRVEPSLAKYSPSKLVIFVNHCIYTLFVTEKVHFSSERSGRYKIIIKPSERRTSLRVHVQRGTKDRPAGIYLGDKVAKYELENTFAAYDGIILEFKWDAWSRLGTDVQMQQRQWERDKMKIHQARATQQDPRVRTQGRLLLGHNQP